MLKKIGQAVIFGLFCAILILFVAPIIQSKGSSFSLSAFTQKEIVSYNAAVKIASPQSLTYIAEILVLKMKHLKLRI
ncbi:hypothetical protein NJNGDCLN_02943 [Mannheimia haemolytica]